MTYSTAKAALVSALEGAGVSVARHAEARDEEELAAALERIAAAPSATPAREAAGAVASPAAGAGARASPARFGGVGLPGMGGVALPGMGGGFGLRSRRHGDW